MKAYDAAPDAHALRIKLSLMAANSSMHCPWDLEVTSLTYLLNLYVAFGIFVSYFVLCQDEYLFYVQKVSANWQ